MRVILTGIAGNICVLFTANDAYIRDLNLFAPACSVSNTAADNDPALQQVESVLKEIRLVERDAAQFKDTQAETVEPGHGRGVARLLFSVGARSHPGDGRRRAMHAFDVMPEGPEEPRSCARHRARLQAARLAVSVPLDDFENPWDSLPIHVRLPEHGHPKTSGIQRRSKLVRQYGEELIFQAVGEVRPTAGRGAARTTADMP